MFGFGFFILIVVASYVANLAAFLTQAGYPDFVATMDEAVEQGKKVCALPALKTELEKAWPLADFVFSESGKSYYGLVDDFDAGKCCFIAIGDSDAAANIELMDMFCARDLVFTDSLIIENQVAFPIRPELASGLSYWMYQGEKQHGITVESTFEEYNIMYKRQPNCSITLSYDQLDSADDTSKISPKNLFFPCMFFLSCAAIATIAKLHHTRQTKQEINKRSLMGRTSTLFITYDASKDPLTCDDDEKNIESEVQSPPRRGLQRRELPGDVVDDFYENSLELTEEKHISRLHLSEDLNGDWEERKDQDDYTNSLEYSKETRRVLSNSGDGAESQLSMVDVPSESVMPSVLTSTPVTTLKEQGVNKNNKGKTSMVRFAA